MLESILETHSSFRLKKHMTNNNNSQKSLNLAFKFG